MGLFLRVVGSFKTCYLYNLMRKIKFCDLGSLNKKKTPYRSSTILDYHVGKIFNIHIGNKFVPLLISSRMKGHKFGEFCLTRKQFSHKKRKK